jgi:L-fuconolactonase
VIETPIVDTHVHFWDPRVLRYAWLGSAGALNRPFLPADLSGECSPVVIDKAVFVEAGADPKHSTAEVIWVSRLAAENAWIAGIVCRAPLEKGEAAAPDLEELARNKLVKGVRWNLQSPADAGMFQSPDLIRGIRLLPRFGLSFDLCVSHIQMESVVGLVRRCPDVRFVLDHIGKPDIRSGLREPWETQTRQLAKMQNVWCKCSGLVTEAGSSWSPEDLKPYIDHVLDCFGFERTMYGGDWPVSRPCTTYPRWVESLRGAVRGCSDGEITRLFRENGAEFYGLQ